MRRQRENKIANRAAADYEDTATTHERTAGELDGASSACAEGDFCSAV